MNKFTKYISISSSAIFTVLTFGYSAVIYALYGGLAEGANISAARTLMFFVFALLLSAANYLLTLPSLGMAVKLPIHALLAGFAFWLCMLLPADMQGSQTLVGMVIFYVIYIIISAVALAICSRRAKKTVEAKEYTPMFGKKN